jgi:hypothetical protein
MLAATESQTLAGVMTASNKILVAVAALAVIVLSGCGADQNTRVSAPALVGADRDEHGCIGSAGYAWCAREAACVRSWELAQQKGFVNSAANFEQHCSSTSP